MVLMYSNDHEGKRLAFTFCTWCNAFITRPSWQSGDKKYHACSKDCQTKLSSLLQSDDWSKLNDRQRKAVMRVGYKRYSEDLEKYRQQQAKEYLTSAKPSKKAKVPRIILKNPEKMLLAHYEAFEKDPEALSSKFLDNIMGWNNEEVKE